MNWFLKILTEGLFTFLMYVCASLPKYRRDMGCEEVSFLIVYYFPSEWYIYKYVSLSLCISRLKNNHICCNVAVLYVDAFLCSHVQKSFLHFLYFLDLLLLSLSRCWGRIQVETCAHIHTLCVALALTRSLIHTHEHTHTEAVWQIQG